MNDLILDQLDYTISTQQERIKHINNIINIAQQEKITLKDFILQKMADYILFSPDSKPLVKKTKYRFYTDVALDMKLKKEQPIEGVKSKNEQFAEDTTSEVIDFLLRNNNNYRVQAKQKIYNSDLQNEDLSCLAEYERYIDQLRDKIKYIKNTTNNMKEIYLYAKHIGLCRQDQLIAKDILKGTIYLKKASESSNNTNYNYVDYNDKQVLKALLKVKKSSIFTDIGIMVKDLDDLINKANLNERELTILNMYRSKDYTEQTIAIKLHMKQPNVNRTINNIITKIINENRKQYIDFINLNYIKGTYKKCPKCQQTKLSHYFGKCKSRTDGLQAYCKQCRKK
ncbi:MAG: hypothetical protein N4A50_06275 [Vallitalea sp.]|jgi:DNA-binding CsgD family transcriptional regulator|nr:hypothetical protein [Vallitalea sp.]